MTPCPDCGGHLPAAMAKCHDCRETIMRGIHVKLTAAELQLEILRRRKEFVEEIKRTQGARGRTPAEIAAWFGDRRKMSPFRRRV